jgi:hypothetical protein
MNALRVLRGALKTISIFIFGLCLVFGWMFYEFYLKWITVFEDGRYFDPHEGVVYHDTSSILGIISLALLLISVVIWLLASKIKGEKKGL